MIRCPNGARLPFETGGSVRFPSAVCAACPLRARCTTSARGRSVAIHPDERLLIELRQRQTTPDGRAKLRERGARKNLFDLRRCAVVHNLHVLARLLQPNAA
jgi:transposase